MDPLDSQIAALESEIAQIQAELATPVGETPTEPSEYNWKQGLFDVGSGAAKAAYGLADVLTAPVVAGANLFGAELPYFGMSKMGEQDINTLAQALNVRPQTAVQEAVSFIAPSPISKAKLAGQVGMGLASYLGFKGAERILPDSSYAGLVGALAAPAAVNKTAAIARGIATKAAPTVGLIAGSDEALRNAAQAEVLAAAGEEGIARLKIAQSISNLSEGTGGVPLTAAEIAQTPSLAKYQQVIRQTQEGGNVLTPAAETRQLELAAALNRFGVEPQQGDFALGLRSVAEQAAAAKATREAGLLSALGVDDLAPKQTKMEIGFSLQKSLLKRAEDSYEPVAEKWDQVNKATKMDIAPQIDEAVKTFDSFDDLTKGRMSSIAQDTIREAKKILSKEDGLITIKEYQGLRASANAALKNATKGTDRAEINLMQTLKQNLDNIDESAIIKGGSGEQVGKLTDAIAATKEYYSVFGRGVVGEIIKQKGGELSLKASQVVDRALKYPENAFDIINKFGRESEEAVALRSELLNRLSKQQNPTRYLGENKDLYQKAFDADYGSLVKYAQSKGRGAPFEEFAKITDTAIPNKIFADATQAKKFANAFKDTEMFQYARSKFINTKLTKSGDPLENLGKNKKIAKEYFPTDLTDLETVLKDIQLAKSPQQLAAAATKGQSWTSQMNTTLGAIMSARGLVGAMKKGLVPGSIIGYGAGPLGSIGGAVGGYIVSRVGNLRESQLNELAAQFLANPTLLNLAKAPPTQKNVKTLLDRAGEMGYLGSKAIQENAVEAASMQQATSDTMDVDAQIEALTKEIQTLQAESTPAPETLKVGKQNISIPQGEQYAPPDLVKAVMKVESAGKQEAVSSKGARGLMQLMPGTAKQLGVDPKDPQENVEGGSRYLQQMISKYGKKDIALAAYNWGPGNIDKAIRQVKADGKRVTWANIMQVVKVPQETRLYVNKVLEQLA
jgi:soluble lytic murein transglycosylase-like protein